MAIDVDRYRVRNENDPNPGNIKEEKLACQIDRYKKNEREQMRDL